MTEIRHGIEEVIKRLIGDLPAMRLGFYTPENVSPANKVEIGYVDSIDGAIRRGESPSYLGQRTSVEESVASEA